MKNRLLGLKGMNDKRMLNCDAKVSNQCSSFSPNGITFRSDKFLPEWTEMEIQMQIPLFKQKKLRSVGCRGVVVQCGKGPYEQDFEVALFFLDLPKQVTAYLETGKTNQIPLTISFAH